MNNQETVLRNTQMKEIKLGTHAYCEISAEVAHEIVVVLPLLAHFAGEAGSPRQSFPDAVIYYPAIHQAISRAEKIILGI